MSGIKSRWESLAFEMAQRVNGEEQTVATLRDHGDANFLVHQGRLLERRDLQRRMVDLTDTFPEEEEPVFAPGVPISEETMQEIISRVRSAPGDSRDIGSEHESFDDLLRRANANM